jgi:hypothetical protein
MIFSLNTRVLQVFNNKIMEAGWHMVNPECVLASSTLFAAGKPTLVGPILVPSENDGCLWFWFWLEFEYFPYYVVESEYFQYFVVEIEYFQ